MMSAYRSRSRPRGGAGDGWSVDGWGAHVYLPGRDAELLREIGVVKQASDAFHDAVRRSRVRDFLDSRDDPWAFGDRLAWEAVGARGRCRDSDVIERLRGHLAPVCRAGPGDPRRHPAQRAGRGRACAGHHRLAAVLQAGGDGQRVAATDAVTFRGASLSLLDEWATGEDWDQLLVRALLYRLGPTGIFAVRGRLMGSLVTHVERVRPVVDAVLSRLPA